MVAWAQLGGVTQLAEPIKELRERGDQCTAVVGIGGGVATKQGLEAVRAAFNDYTLGDGKLTRREMYADPAEALKAAGLTE